MRKLLLLPGVLFAFGTVALNAAPVSLSLTGNSSLTSASTFTATGSGSLSPLGSASLSVSGLFDPTFTTGTGAFGFDFGAGNTLSGTFNVPIVLFVPGGNAGSASGTVDITAGTGSFAGDSGTFTITGSATATGPTTAAFTLEGSGDIAASAPSSDANSGGPGRTDTPEPASYLLVAAGALLTFASRRKAIRK